MRLPIHLKTRHREICGNPMTITGDNIVYPASGNIKGNDLTKQIIDYQ
ncbi:MAG: hypothetical protein ACKOYP_04120 [Bacteroidota bacterium]